MKKKVKKLKQIYNHYLEKKKDIMNSTKFSVEDVFGSSEKLSGEQIEKLNNFLAKMM